MWCNSPTTASVAVPVAAVVGGCIVINHTADRIITRGQEIAGNGRYNFDWIHEY
jgi:hypothetical protein